MDSRRLAKSDVAQTSNVSEMAALIDDFCANGFLVVRSAVARESICQTLLKNHFLLKECGNLALLLEKRRTTFGSLNKHTLNYWKIGELIGFVPEV